MSVLTESLTLSIPPPLSLFSLSTIICESFGVKTFRFAQSDKIFLYENSLPVLANIWRVFEVDENIVTRIFLAQKFCKRN